MARIERLAVDQIMKTEVATKKVTEMVTKVVHKTLRQLTLHETDPKERERATERVAWVQ